MPLGLDNKSGLMPKVNIINPMINSINVKEKIYNIYPILKGRRKVNQPL